MFYFINMKLLKFKSFIKKYNLKNDTMNESDLQRVCNYSIYPRDSKNYSDKGFVNIDNGSQSVAIGLVSISKITNHFTLTHLVVFLIIFY